MFISNSQTYGNEILSVSLRSKFSAVSFICFGLAGVAVNLISFKVDHFSFYIYLSAGSIAVTTPLYFYLVESPFHLYKKRRIEHLYRSLLTICERNHAGAQFLSVKSRLHSKLRYCKAVELRQKGQYASGQVKPQKSLHQPHDLETPPSDTPELPGQEPSESSGTVGKRDLLTFAMLVVLFVDSEGIAVMSLIVNKQLGISSVQFSGIFVTTFQILGFLAGLWLVPRLGRRTVNIKSAALVCVYSGSILVIDLVSNHFVDYFERGRTVRVVETGNRDECSLC